MKVRLMRITGFLFALALFVTGKSQTTNDAAPTIDVDPIITQLDSMSYSLLTRDKDYVSHDELSALVNMPYDLIPKYSEADISEKMKLIPTDVPMSYNAYVKQFIDMFAYRKRGLMTRCLANSQIYFPIFEQILDKKGIPLEFKYLPIVESAFNPVAVSKCGATGLWQLMYGTGSMLGLQINSYIDERRDPIKSTEAAADYLNKLYDIYGDWHLVLAAYNSGPGNVNKAIARAGGTKNFWAVMNYLPAETRSYVPCFIAAVYVMENASDYKLMSAEPKRELYAVDTVMITEKVSLAHVSDVLGIGEDELQFLNPSLKKGVVPYTKDGFPLNLPVNYFAQFEAKKEIIMTDSSQAVVNTEAIIAAAPKWVYHKVSSGQSLGLIASKYGVSTTSIKKWNGLKNSYIYPGQKLKIYTSGGSTTVASSGTTAKYDQVFASNKVLNGSTDSLNKAPVAKAAAVDSVSVVSGAKCIYHVVQAGDTLWNITQRYEGLTIEKLKADNKQIQDRPIKVGDVLKIII